MNEDILEYEILPDGRIKFTTSKISQPNHASADEFLRMVRRLSGGESVRVRRTDVDHAHQHVHQHDKQEQ